MDKGEAKADRVDVCTNVQTHGRTFENLRPTLLGQLAGVDLTSIGTQKAAKAESILGLTC